MSQAQVWKILKKNPKKWFRPIDLEKLGVDNAGCACRKISYFYKPEIERRGSFSGGVYYKYVPTK